MLDWIFLPEAWLSLFTLASLEIVLGIDNIIFIAIMCNKLPLHQRDKARYLGLGFAMITRILLLLTLFVIMKLTKPLFYLFGLGISGRDLILIVGGAFLIIKSVMEILHSVKQSGESAHQSSIGKGASFFVIVFQIGILDIVFSLDSVITAVGMANHLEIMILAVIIAVIVMLFASGAISKFIDKNPTIKILALAFLVLIGVFLIIDGFGIHLSKSYLYFAMGFSLSVELINIYIKKRSGG
ncbi:TerC family protein [uncultured Campylobacter sp.]|uniref:TerC family protein n=1 Tax=uncultured Campylobacter sp. TaxID=218934 RepID=UPI002604397B|nr:TerC family protein [uncultured Campylobacter sp.]